ncbi:hypothetical protein Z517_00070 [Fonsecaea pedrosoi CBS 271.37]|uniref:Unplaced genomic scaffold supercont1.1, whole genome shotgun sequence n=1 Tax=Fonsecaea pedrosoi CBS 271.37 TaxID=1442368 RepID=A0A0D2FDI4_9EURO|nr:uncharacterized protein Z517_00070 [Fonsecaea pedrosoi CBS 271.37]KIW84682.1 hypothetical protein Z517_00070 [Fonsecaea pedrosoi CBS 271.37]
MESSSLERASQYLNNLLLARGLLSNGKPIDFARPDRHGSGTNPTMSRIINLVHGLILRRDQDAENRENLAIQIRQARADEAQHVLDLQRLQAKNADLSRAAAAAEAQERALTANVRKLETQAKELREQMLKLKSTLDQVRAKCLSDVRKRDAELDKLKAFLAGMQRGKKDSSGMKINTINWQPEVQGRELRNGQDVNSSEWSLEKETNQFLTELVNETSTENVSLRRIVTDTMRILRDISGLEDMDAGAEHKEVPENETDISDHYHSDPKSTLQQPQPEDLTSCDELAEHMTAILGHCQSILKDPSFVPIEEVEIRDEEIIKLRGGWEKMASRWKEAVTMMDTWRRRMVENNEGLSRDDLSRLEFGKSVAMLPNGQPVFGTDDELSSILYESSKLEEGEQEPEHGEFPANSEQENTGHLTSTRSNVVKRGPTKRELTVVEPDLDIPPAHERSPKRRASIARKAGNLGKPIRPLQATELNHLNRSPKPGWQRWTKSRESADSGIGSLDGGIHGKSDSDDDDENYGREPGKRAIDLGSRIPRQVKRPGPVLSIDEKLIAIEAEALETQRDLKSADSTTSRKRKHGANAAKTRKASRRRSTLSPEELAELMGIE